MDMRPFCEGPGTWATCSRWTQLVALRGGECVVDHKGHIEGCSNAHRPTME
jgi:hypothetical protein